MKYKLWLGPMAGVTDMPFRLLCREMGAEVCCTEMVSAKALHYGNRNTEELLVRSPAEHPLAVQIFGSEPEVMAEQAEALSDRFDMIDINMGCPVAKVVNNGEGSALMKDPELVYRIVEAVCRRAKKPVTVKLRKGFDEAHVNAAEVAMACQAGGAAAVAVHGRTREQFYTGRADWEIIRRVKAAVSLPVIGNGDILSGADALRMLAETGCDGVMIARGARGNPWLFREVRAALAGEPAPPPPDRAEKREVILRHGQLLIEEKGEYTAVRELRKHLAWYTAGMAGSAAFRSRTNSMETYADFASLVNIYFK